MGCDIVGVQHCPFALLIQVGDEEMLRDVQETRTWISRGRFVRLITLAALILAINYDHLVADTATLNSDNEIPADFKRFVYGYSSDAVFRTIYSDKIYLNVVPLGEYSIEDLLDYPTEDVVNNLLPNAKKFRPVEVNYYDVYNTLALVSNNTISIFYGTKQEILTDSAYLGADASSAFMYPVEMGPTIAVNSHAHGMREEEGKEYVEINDQETICTQYIMTNREETNTYSFLFIEHTDSFNTCLIKQILFKIGLRNVAKDLFVERELDSTDLSQMIEFLLEHREYSGLTFEEFIDEYRSSTD
ncbi:MAG: hypothetical protein AAF563_22470 [Pseudomonadota bacterium]